MAKRQLETVPVESLVLDFTLYPREHVDNQHVRRLAEALRAGAKLPPIVADKKTRCLIDGFHRVKAWQQIHDGSKRILVEWRSYKNEEEKILDALRLNARHGQRLSEIDQLRGWLLAEQCGCTMKRVASALNITTHRLESLREAKTATCGAETVILKPAVRHMAGKNLSRKQANALRKIGGNNVLFYVNQLTLLIKNDMLDARNENLMRGLRKLHALLGHL